MPDDPPDGLVYSPGCLQIVPFLPTNGFGVLLPLLVQVVSLEDDFGVLVIRIGDAEYDDTPSGIVREVNALAQFSTAYAHQYGTCVAVLFPHDKDFPPETLDLGLELLLIGGFHEDTFLAQGLNP